MVSDPVEGSLGAPVVESLSDEPAKHLGRSALIFSSSSARAASSSSGMRAVTVFIVTIHCVTIRDRCNVQYATFTSSGCRRLRDDATLQHAILECATTMLEDVPELVGVVRIEEEFVVLKRRVDPFVEPLAVRDLIANAYDTDACHGVIALSGPGETSEEIFPPSLSIVENQYERLNISPGE